MYELPSLLVFGDDHEGLSRVELLTELNDTVKIVVEQFFIFDVQFTFAKGVLVSFVHVENDLLVGVWALEEIGYVALLLNELH